MYDILQKDTKGDNSMACMSHECNVCKKYFMNNEWHDFCPYCKSEKSVTNWFDEAEDFEPANLIDEEE
jgi:Zn finger protein HypA/HybF involved in hydrogenase expression